MNLLFLMLALFEQHKNGSLLYRPHNHALNVSHRNFINEKRTNYNAFNVMIESNRCKIFYFIKSKVIEMHTKVFLE